MDELQTLSLMKASLLCTSGDRPVAVTLFRFKGGYNMISKLKYQRSPCKVHWH